MGALYTNNGGTLCVQALFQEKVRESERERGSIQSFTATIIGLTKWGTLYTSKGYSCQPDDCSESNR